MGYGLWVWLQSWIVSTSAGLQAQDLRLFSGYAQDVWVAYRANRQGQVHLFLHHLDTSGYQNLGRTGLCLSEGDSTGIQAWEATLGEQNTLYVAWSTQKGTSLTALNAQGLFLWRFFEPAPAAQLTILPHPEGGAVLLKHTGQHLLLSLWTGTGQKLLEESLAPDQPTQRKGRLTFSGPEGFWVIWEAFDGQHWQAWMQKWRWDVRPETPPQPLSTLPHSIEKVEFIGDGFGGLLGVYERVSLTGAGKDLYLFRYNRSGRLLYEAPLCTEAGDQQNPRLYKRGTDLLVVWEDNRQQDWDLYYQRIDLNSGRPLLPAQGVGLLTLPGPQRNPHLVLDYFQNELIAVWIDYRRLQGDLYLQRYSAEGKPLWEFTGRPLIANTRQQHTLQVAAQDFQYFWVGYLEDYPQEGTYPHLALLTTQGEVRWQKGLWGNRQRPHARCAHLQAYPWGRRLFLCWADDRDSAKALQLYGQVLEPDQTTFWPISGRPIAPQPHLSQEEAQITFRQDTLWVLWQGRESDVEADLFAQAMLPTGERLFAQPFVVCGADRVQQEARWLSTPTKLYAYWTDSRSLEETGFDLYVRSVKPPAPEAGWRTQRPFENSAYLLPVPEKAAFHHLWQEEIAGKYQYLYAFGPLGEVPAQPLLLSPTAKPQRFLHAIGTPSGFMYAAFCEEAPGPYEQTLRLYGLSPTGSVVWQASSPLGYKHHLYPKLWLLSNGDLVLTALGSPAAGRWELAYARYSPNGTLQEKGVLLSPVPENVRWQLIDQRGLYWLLVQLPTGYTLHTGKKLDALKPTPLPEPLGEGTLCTWQGKTWLFACSRNREKLFLMPLTPLP